MRLWVRRKNSKELICNSLEFLIFWPWHHYDTKSPIWFRFIGIYQPFLVVDFDSSERYSLTAFRRKFCASENCLIHNRYTIESDWKCLGQFLLSLADSLGTPKIANFCFVCKLAIFSFGWLFPNCSRREMVLIILLWRRIGKNNLSGTDSHRLWCRPHPRSSWNRATGSCSSDFSRLRRTVCSSIFHRFPIPHTAPCGWSVPRSNHDVRYRRCPYRLYPSWRSNVWPYNF